MSKVMLVEDDNNLREIYEARLQAEGYTIVSAHDGEEALVIAKNELPDLIISDVMMPKISGFEMLDILRNTEGLKDVKVIMLTALGQSDDQQRATRLGADRYLVKSQVTLEDIVKVAQDLLGGGEAVSEPVAAPEPVAVADPSAVSEPAPVVAEQVADVPESSIDLPAPPTAPEVPVVPAPADDPVPVVTNEPVVVDDTPIVTDTDVTPAPPENDVVATEPTSEPTVKPTPTPTSPVLADEAAVDDDFINSLEVTATAAGSELEAQSTADETAEVESQIENYVFAETAEAPAEVEMPESNTEDASEASVTSTSNEDAFATEAPVATDSQKTPTEIEVSAVTEPAPAPVEPETPLAVEPVEAPIEPEAASAVESSETPAENDAPTESEKQEAEEIFMTTAAPDLNEIAAPASPQTSDNEANDGVMANALEDLLEGDKGEPSVEPATSATAAPETPPEEAESFVPKRSKQIIPPLDAPDKPSLESLLALEEAKEIAGLSPAIVIPGPTISAPESSTDSAPKSEDAQSDIPVAAAPTEPGSTPADDPNNIAL